MTEIQEHLLVLLKEIDSICKANDITYYLDGGTALGAVRHRGFLPWDDDADIVFTRKEFLRFVQAVRRENRSDRIIAGPDNSPEYAMVYSRYCDISTTCILRTTMLDQFQSGLFIDLFILDPIPDTPEAVGAYFDLLSGYAELRNPFYHDVVVGANAWYDRLKQMEQESGREAVDRFVEESLFQGVDGEGMTYAFRYDLEQFVYPRYIFQRVLHVPFEGELLPVAGEFGDYLRIHYGDQWYMIPGKTEVQTHNVAIDLHVPYETFKNSYMGLLDKPKALATYRRFHDLRIQYDRMTREIDTSRYRLTAEIFASVIRKKMQTVSPLALLAEKDYSGLREFLGNYADIQLNRWYLKNRVLIVLPDEAMYCALRLLLYDGRYGQSDKILRLYQESGLALDSRLESIQQIIGTIRSLWRCFEQGENAAALHLAERAYHQYPDIPDVTEALLWAREKQISSAAEAQALLTQMEGMEDRTLHRDRVRAVRELLYIRFGSQTEARRSREALCRLREETRDGLLKLELEDLEEPNLVQGGETNE
ncbi:MAG: LicD family protein [Clostridiaceae bacterium]|nr:LicD family protein [Clostridiaceae bacterium]